MGRGVSKLGAKGEKLANNITKRPSSFRKKTVQDAWDNAASGTKQKTRSCPTCGKDVEIPPVKVAEIGMSIISQNGKIETLQK